MNKVINHPRPQFRRSKWLDLNGQWGFSYDDEHIGLEQKWQAGFKTDLEITVPFVYQSEKSGINDQTFHDTVWYQKKIHVDKLKDQNLFIHFEGVDYGSTLWLNGVYVGEHVGGNSRFTFDISPFVVEGDNTLVLKVWDSLEDMTLPRGKQYWKEKAEVMWFKQMTGIWRDVWMEYVPTIALKDCRLTPNIDQEQMIVELNLSSRVKKRACTLRTTVSFKGELVSQESRLITSDKMKFVISLVDFNDHGLGRWWSPEAPNLYDIAFELIDGDKIIDQVESYFGMRKVATEQNKFCLNNRPYYLRLILDQGYFKESILTPPSFEALEKDVILTKELGFNGIRKHMMSCEPKFLYLCDYYGVVVWSEMAGAYDYSEEYAYRMVEEWKTVITTSYNHPSVVTWVPLNESWGVPDIYYSEKQQAHAQSLYYLTKSIDDTRPVISNDGWEHCKSDLFTVHDYSADLAVLENRYSSVENIIKDMPGLEGRKFLYCPGYEYNGEPVMCTEMGGLNYRLDGLGDPVEPRFHNESDFLSKLADVLTVYYESKIIEGICYTQLTDTETEICGLLTWDRVPKAPIEKIRKIILKN